MRTFRIFVSSPGDCAEERLVAARVIDRLGAEFAQWAKLEAILWENEPLLASETFQTQIPDPTEADIVLFILWARLGSMLPGELRRADGSRYLSGTEYEFELAITSYRQRRKPEIVMYRKAIEAKVSLSDAARVREQLEQKEKLDTFLTRWFHHPDEPVLTGAFHEFRDVGRFEELLTQHLRKLIRRRLPDLDEPGLEGPEPTWTAGSPFRGLESFEARHTDIFFGRTRAVGGVIQAVRAQVAANEAFVMLIGASGSGKSSVMHAGIVPTLSSPQVLEGAWLWRVWQFKPADLGPDPVQGLTDHLVQREVLPELLAGSTNAESLAEELRRVPEGLAVLVRGALQQAAAEVAHREGLPSLPSGHLLVAIDQFEEFFTRESITGATRTLIFRMLRSLARSGRAVVIVTMRSDFFPRCQEYPELVELMQGQGLYHLLPPTSSEIAQIIRQPVLAAGLQFETDAESQESLAEELHAHALEHPENLPLLEFTLEQLYRKREGRQLTIAAYRELDGIIGAITHRAEETYSSLPRSVQGAFAKVFRLLVTVGGTEEGAVVRRTASLDEFAGIPDGAQFVQQLIEARLLVSDIDDTGQAVVSLAHEALLRHWPRLQTWVEDNRELLHIRAHLETAAAAWDAHGRRRDMLLVQGKALEDARLFRESDLPLMPVGDEYVAASFKQARGRQRGQRAGVAVLVLLTLVATSLSIFADRQREKAEEAEYINRRERVLATILAGQNQLQAGQYKEAHATLWSAYHDSPAVDLPPQLSLSALSDLYRQVEFPRMAVASHERNARGVGWSPDNQTVYTSSIDTTIKYWDANDGSLVDVLPDEPEQAHMRWSQTADGSQALTGENSGQVTVWDLQAREKRAVYDFQSGGLLDVAWDPAGTAFLGAAAQTSRGSSAPLQVYDLNATDPRWVAGTDLFQCFDAGWSAEGVIFATLGADGVQAFDARNGEFLRQSAPREQAVHVLSLHDESDRLALSSFEPASGIVVLAGDDLHEISAFGKEYGDIRCLEWTPGGGQLLMGDYDENQLLFDVETGTVARRFAGHDQCMSSAALAPDERTWATGGCRGDLKLWDNVPDQELLAMGVDMRPRDLSWSPDGRLLASSLNTTQLGIWDAETGTLLLQREVDEIATTDVSWSPDGRMVATTGTGSYSPRFWDARTGAFLREGEVQDGETPFENYYVDCIAWSPDSRSIVGNCWDYRIKVWEAGTGAMTQFLAYEATEPGYDIQWSPDGSRILAAHRDRKLSQIDATSGAILDTTTVQTEWTTSLRRSPTEPLLLTGSTDTILNAWALNADNLDHLASRDDHLGTINGIDWSRDGRYFATAGGDQTLRFWARDGFAQIHALEIAGNELTDCRFAPQDLRVAVGGEAGLFIWDIERPRRYLEREIPGFWTALLTKPEVEQRRYWADWWFFRRQWGWALDEYEAVSAMGGAVDPLRLAKLLVIAERHDEALPLIEGLLAGASGSDELTYLTHWKRAAEGVVMLEGEWATKQPAESDGP